MKVLIILLFPALCLGELSADLNGDGTVNMTDFAIMMDEWLMSDYYLNFADLDKYVSVANNAVLIPGTGDFTISLREYGGTEGVLISKKWWTGGQANGYAIDMSGTAFRCTHYNTAIISTILPSTATWHHIVWSHDADGNDVLYIDNVADTTSTASADNYSSTATIIIGMQLDAPLNYFDGAIDDIRIYKGVALTATQVSDIYYCGSGWKVNEAEFSAVTSNGWYSNCDDGTGLALTGRLLTAGTWSAHNGVLQDADFWAAGGVPFNTINLDSEFEEYTRYINRTSKRIQFRFRSKDDFQVREYKILNPHVESDR